MRLPCDWSMKSKGRGGVYNLFVETYESRNYTGYDDKNWSIVKKDFFRSTWVYFPTKIHETGIVTHVILYTVGVNAPFTKRYTKNILIRKIYSIHTTCLPLQLYWKQQVNFRYRIWMLATYKYKIFRSLNSRNLARCKVQSHRRPWNHLQRSHSSQILG